MEWAEQFVHISEEEKEIISHARKTLLFDKNKPWVKKDNPNFDTTMGGYDGAEECELVGLYLLSQLRHLKIRFALYRDDGAGISSQTPRQNEIMKKEICNIFQRNGLKITIKTNMKTIDFLDVTLDLRTNTFKPFNKPNNTPLYINVKSN